MERKKLLDVNMDDFWKNPDAPPPEVTPIGPDIDQPAPGMPAGDPGTSQPAEI